LSLISFQMTRVISSPSMSTTGFLTLIFFMRRCSRELAGPHPYGAQKIAFG
jgi:hypothetical protein